MSSVYFINTPHSGKAGYLKSQKNLRSKTSNFGNALRSKTSGFGEAVQSYGQLGSKFYDNSMVKTGFKTIGQVLGSVAIPVPIVGGKIGKMAGETLANKLSYTHGLIGEVGGMLTGEKNIGDVLSYVPKRIWEDIKDNTINSDTAKVITGRMNWRDAVVNNLEEAAMIDFLAPNKTHAWKDQQGNYHREYVNGAKMVVGEWVNRPNNENRPNLSSNEGIIGVGKNGEILYKGFN